MYEHNQPDGTKRMRGNFLLSSAFYYISLFEEENNGGMCQLLYHSSVLFFNPGILGKTNLTPMSIAKKKNTTVCDCQFVLIELTSKMSFWSWILYALKLIMYCSQWNCFSWSSVPNCEQIALYCTDPNIFQTRACYSNGQSCHIPPIFEPKKKNGSSSTVVCIELLDFFWQYLFYANACHWDFPSTKVIIVHISYSTSAQLALLMYLLQCLEYTWIF